MTNPDDSRPASEGSERSVSGRLHPDSIAIRSGRDGNGSALAPVLWATSAFVTPDSATATAMATST